jgi:hypothetical protein
MAVRESSVEVSGSQELQSLIGLLGSEWYFRAAPVAMECIALRDPANPLREVDWIAIDSDEGPGVHLAVRNAGEMSSLWEALISAGVQSVGMPPAA